ncbi:hypothetical protein GCM10009075_24250 [Sphingomonas trueperi]
MRLDDLDPTDNARDLGSGGGGGFPLLGLLPMFLGRGMGCGGIVLVGIIALVMFGLGGGGGAAAAARPPRASPASRSAASTSAGWKRAG